MWSLPVPLMTPESVKPTPDAMLTVFALVVMGILTAEPLTPELTVRPLVSTMLLPARVKLLLANVMDANDVPEVMLLVVLVSVDPEKTKAAPVVGTESVDQLAAVFQYPFPPPPVHVTTLSKFLPSSGSMCNVRLQRDSALFPRFVPLFLMSTAIFGRENRARS